MKSVYDALDPIVSFLIKTMAIVLQLPALNAMGRAANCLWAWKVM